MSNKDYIKRVFGLKRKPPTYKRYDWVYIVKSDLGSNNEPGDIGIIKEIDANHNAMSVCVKGRSQFVNWHHISEIRLATKSEIKSVK